MRFVYFDCLRGLAAYIVVIGHFFPESSYKALPIINLITDTKLAVAIFFVLSGFVLTQADKNRTKNITWLVIVSFARLIRLLIPVCAASILVYLLVTFDLMFEGELPSSYSSFQVYKEIYSSNISLIELINFVFVEAFFLYNNQTTLLPPAWTMRPELFGSCCIFLLISLQSQFSKNVNPYFLILLAILLLLTHTFLPFLYYSGFFLMGSAFRLLHNRLESKKAISIYFLLSTLILKTCFEYKGIDHFYLDFAFASIIVYQIMRCSSAHSFLNRGVFYSLGSISFPMYLIHVPIISSAGLYSLEQFNSWGLHPLSGLYLAFFVITIATIFVSLALLTVENASIKFSRTIRKYGFKFLL